MIINGVYYPNISCNFCGFRHHPGVSCAEAARIAENNRVNETNAPTGPDLNSLKDVLREMFEAYDKGGVGYYSSERWADALSNVRKMYDQLKGLE